MKQWYICYTNGHKESSSWESLTSSAYFLHRPVSFSSGVLSVFRVCMRTVISLPTSTEMEQNVRKKTIKRCVPLFKHTKLDLTADPGCHSSHVTFGICLRQQPQQQSMVLLPIHENIHYTGTLQWVGFDVKWLTDWLTDWKTGHCSVPKPFTFFFSWDFLCCFSMLLFAPLTFPSSGLSSSLVRSLSSGLCDWPLGRVLVSSEMLSRQYVLRMSSSCRLSSSAMSQWDCAASATKQSGGW